MKVSVVIPVYNGARYVGKAIESVLGQEYPAHEIIVIDDGSTDTTPEVLNSFRDKIITKRIQNSGASNARNVGMALVDGDAIAFLDADDWWFKYKLKKHVELALRFPEIGFFCSNYIVRAKDEEKLTLRRHYSKLHYLKDINFNTPLKTHPFNLLLKVNFIGTPSAVLIRREIVSKAGPFSDIYRPAEDYDYWLRCATLTNFVVMEDVLIYKRTHDKNLSNDLIRTGLSHKKVLEGAARDLRDYIQEYGFSDTLSQAMADWEFGLGNKYFESGKKKEAFRSYWEAFLIRKSFANAFIFLKMVFKKTFRILTFDTLSRRNLNQ